MLSPSANGFDTIKQSQENTKNEEENATPLWRELEIFGNLRKILQLIFNEISTNSIQSTSKEFVKEYEKYYVRELRSFFRKINED